MICGQRCGDPAGHTQPSAIYVRIDPDNPDARILSWTPEHSSGVYHKVMIDGLMHATTAATELDDFPQDARDQIQIIEVSTQNYDEDLEHVADSAYDTAKLAWNEVSGADYYELYRSLTSGVYNDPPIAVIRAGESTYAYYDRALDDDTYYYRVTAYDAAGNSVNSNEAGVTISSAPDAPSGLTLTVTAGTLELAWTASPSSDVSVYNIYRSAAAGDSIDILAAPHATPASSPWNENMSTETGHFEYLLRAEDADGNEEDNLGQMVMVDLDTGSRVNRPNTPGIMSYEAIAAGQVRLSVRYSRASESGVAVQVRLYVNDGAGGAVDYNTAVGTANLASGADVQAVDVDSTGLSGGLTYLCAVRAATAGGVCDTNTNTVEVTTDATAPSAPSITAEIV